MAGEFIRKWLGKPPAVPSEVREALAELNRLAETQPPLAALARFFIDLLPGLYQEPVREVPPSLTQEQAAMKLAGGVPLLRGENLTLDEPTFRWRWNRVCEAAQRQRTDNAGRQLIDALNAGRLNPAEMMQGVLAGRPEEILARADRLGLDAPLTSTVLRLTLFPVMTHLGVLLAPLHEGVSWEHGYCPVCGSWPLVGEFRGLEQIRFLRCELCAAAWPFPRLACPYCGMRDHRLLGYLHVEGEESSHRAATCDGCRGYIKMTATLAELPGPRLLAADLATVHLDLAAADRGYTRPPPSEHRI
ncbi:MAG TPA: formate dehydrogenase accessory protein FdhE [Gemmataceae bacterium]|nr:formate dehydrogenase accessory protein FdhE [Gemmataceae bacterium]